MRAKWSGLTRHHKRRPYVFDIQILCNTNTFVGAPSSASTNNQAAHSRSAATLPCNRSSQHTSSTQHQHIVCFSFAFPESERLIGHLFSDGLTLEIAHPEFEPNAADAPAAPPPPASGGRGVGATKGPKLAVASTAISFK